MKMIWLHFALKSAIARKSSLLIIVASTAISVAILLGVMKLQDDAKTSFSNAISGVDLVVGAKGSPTELMLYSVFHIGKPSNTISAQLQQDMIKLDQVSWAVPIQLGDSYRNFPVVGTSVDFFKHVKAQGKPLQFKNGSALTDPKLFDVVLGFHVAKKLNHVIGQKIAVSHGSGVGPKQDHSDSPFKIVGILEATGTPIDHAVFISTNAFDALHDLQDGQLQFAKFNQASQVNAYFVGLKNRISVFSVRQKIENLNTQNLMAVMPGVALDDLWSTMEVAENALILIAYGVLFTTILGITATLLISLESRRRELAIFRAVGAKPHQITVFILMEALIVCLIGIVIGWILLQIMLMIFSDYLRTQWAVISSSGLPNANDALSLLLVLCVVMLAACIPAFNAYRSSLNESLNPPFI